MVTRPPRTVMVYDSGFAPSSSLSASRRSPARTSSFSPAYVSPSSPATSRPSSARPASLTTTRRVDCGFHPGPRAGVWALTAGMVRGVVERA